MERQINFADWELMRQGLRLEPLLQAISNFLDDQQDVIERVRSDLVRGLKNAATGRSGLTPQQVLRSLVLMRVKNWDYRELRERIADGYTLRQFTDFHSRRVPRHDAFHRGIRRWSGKCSSSRLALGPEAHNETCTAQKALCHYLRDVI
jgi:transposase, IS5 family